VAEVNKAILGAVASARKGLAAQQPKLPKGRPSTQAAKAAARTKKRLAAQGAALFTHRYLFVQRHLKKLFSPTLEKALTFLDDKLLPSTSNAVERGNRRYRKMQKSVYRVRTQAQIRARLALDMWREAQAEGRQQTLAVLHRARAG
jgi:hypothetical protein